MADMQALLNAFLDMLMSVFPTSPFASTIDELEQLPYLGYLNWVIPVSQMLTIGTAWLDCPVDQADPVAERGNCNDISVLRHSRIREKCPCSKGDCNPAPAGECRSPGQLLF